METDKHFDDHIKKLMNDLTSPLPADAWMVFEKHLQASTQNDLSESDKIIAEKLRKLQVPIQGSEWHLMQQHLKANELEETEAFDRAISQKLNNLQRPFRPLHWELMAHRIEQEYSLRARLYRYKIIEATLILLLLLNVIRYAPLLENSTTSLSYYEEHSIRSEHLSNPGNDLTTVTTDVRSNSGENSSTQKHSALQPTTGGHPVPIFRPSPRHLPNLNQSAQILIGKKGKITSHPIPPADENLHTGLVLEPVQGNEATDDTAIPGLRPGTENALATPLKAMPSVSEAPASAPYGLPEVDLQFLKSPVLKPFLLSVADHPKSLRNLLSSQTLNRRPTLRFSSFAVLDMNYVYMPFSRYDLFDTIFTVRPNLRDASGYGGGILISKKKSNWEIQTGGIYTFKQYVPSTPTYIFETASFYIIEDLSSIQFDILQVPLNVQYHLLDNKHWRIYGNLGISAHLITTAIYEIHQSRIPNFNRAKALPPSTPDDTRSIRKEKSFPNGFFDGGALGDNLYISGNLGFGAEYSFGPRWSLFIQPNYLHYLSKEGVSANKDKFYTFSLLLGTRINAIR